MKKLIMVFVLSLLSFGFISGCDNSNSGSVATVSGTAATGKGIVGTVIVKDANGVEVNSVSNADGSYSVQVPNMTPPFIIQVIPNDGSPTLYSFATAPGQTVNVTPLTNQAMSIASGNADLSSIFTSWDGTGITETQVDNAEAILRANLSAQITAAGLDPKTLDLFNDAFDADGSGIDGVLDILTFSTDTNGVISFIDETDPGFSFNPDIDITGFVGTSTTGSGGGRPLGPDETVAVIPASIAGTYNLTFSESTTGSGIADGTTTEFVVGTDGTLTIDSTTMLTDPVLFMGNAHEAIWFDTANNLQYALSSLLTGFNEINVGSGVHFNEPGFTFFGQYRNGSVMAPAAFVCPDLKGHVDISGNIATDAITGPVHCPTSHTTAGITQISFSDPGGPVDFNAHPGSSLTIFAANGFETGGSTSFMITYNVGGNVWEKEVASGVLSNSGVIVDSMARTITFSGSSVTILPARALNPGSATGQIMLSGTVNY